MNALAVHLAAIDAGTVTKTNVIGIRKAINHVERLRDGLSGNRSAATIDEVFAVEEALDQRPPLVTGELHASGLKALRNPRYAKRFDERQRGIIESSNASFRLVRFDRIGRHGLHAIPVYQISAPRGYCERPNGTGWSTGGKFLFRIVPWQTAWSFNDVIDGPEVMEAE